MIGQQSPGYSPREWFTFLDGTEQRKIKIAWIADLRVNHFVDNYITDELGVRIKLGFWGFTAEYALFNLMRSLIKINNTPAKQYL